MARRVRKRATKADDLAKREVSETSWPFPDGVGDNIPPEWRSHHIPRDEFYYLSFPWKNTQEEMKPTLERIGKLGLPFEYALSPSGCVCYRLHRKHENLPEIHVGTNMKETVPVVLPAMQYGREVDWRMNQQESMLYLFKDWKPVPKIRQPRQRQKERTVRRRKR